MRLEDNAVFGTSNELGTSNRSGDGNPPFDPFDPLSRSARKMPAFVKVRTGQTVSFKRLIRSAACALMPCGAPISALKAGAIVLQSMALKDPQSLPYVPEQEYYSDIICAVDECFLQYTDEPIIFAGLEGEGIEFDMKQSVAFASQGDDCIRILNRFCDNVKVLTAYHDGIRSDRPLTFGARGEDVRRVQNSLNRISMLWRSIPKIQPDGIFGTETENAVREFQRVNFLRADGIVGKATDVELYYAALRADRMIEAAEKRCEGLERIPLPGGKGMDTELLQRMLKTLSEFYPRLKMHISEMEKEWGYYGEATADCVSCMQDIYGSARSGVCSMSDICKIVHTYISIQKLLPQPLNEGLTEFDGRELYEGCVGDTVYLASRYLREISAVFTGIPFIEASDVFTPQMHNAVVQFQLLFCAQDADGRIEESTWNRMTEICRDVRASMASGERNGGGEI